MTASSKKDARSTVLSLVLAGAVLSSLVAQGAEAFSSPSAATISQRSLSVTKHEQQQRFVSSFQTTATKRTQQYGTCASSSKLFAAKGSGGKKRRRRKRKKAVDETRKQEAAPAATTTPPSVAAAVVSPPSTKLETAVADTTETLSPPPSSDDEEVDVSDLQGVASFSFSGGDVLAPRTENVLVPPTTETSGDNADSTQILPDVVRQEDGLIPLPDIRDTLRRKKMEVANMGGSGDVMMEDNMPKGKIDRNDRKALLKLLEQDPYADGDDSFFEEQEYTVISAWLGERSKPFLGIPTGPLQVGHFIGALIIVLMAFIEYPGFPLTNLPTPIRGALQGGLGTVYGINLLLAVFAGFKASERGQPLGLWIAKTITVGGLALDQLTQLPTTEQVEAAKARKGKRALKNRKR